MSIPRGLRRVVCLWAGVLVAGCGNGTHNGGTGAAGVGATAGAGGSSAAGTGGGAAGAAGSQGTAGTSGAAGKSGAAGTAGGAGTTGAAGSGTMSGAAGGGADPYAAARQACVDKINMFRATLNVPPLTRWTAEEACTDGEAKSDSESGTAHGAFGACKESAQDECPGWATVDSIAGGTKSCLDQMWAEGPGTDFSTHGHYINMSNPKYKMVACGYSMTSTGKIWAAQDFK
jgi:hypothetical protein